MAIASSRSISLCARDAWMFCSKKTLSSSDIVFTTLIPKLYIGKSLKDEIISILLLPIAFLYTRYKTESSGIICKHFTISSHTRLYMTSDAFVMSYRALLPAAIACCCTPTSASPFGVLASITSFTPVVSRIIRR